MVTHTENIEDRTQRLLQSLSLGTESRRLTCQVSHDAFCPRDPKSQATGYSCICDPDITIRDEAGVILAYESGRVV